MGGSPDLIVPTTRSRKPSLLKSAHAALLSGRSKIPVSEVTSLNVSLPSFLKRNTLRDEESISVFATIKSCFPSLLKSPHAAVCPRAPTFPIPTSFDTFSKSGKLEELFEPLEPPAQDAINAKAT